MGIGLRMAELEGSEEEEKEVKEGIEGSEETEKEVKEGIEGSEKTEV